MKDYIEFDGMPVALFTAMLVSKQYLLASSEVCITQYAFNTVGAWYQGEEVSFSETDTVQLALKVETHWHTELDH